MSFIEIPNMLPDDTQEMKELMEKSAIKTYMRKLKLRAMDKVLVASYEEMYMAKFSNGEDLATLHEQMYAEEFQHALKYRKEKSCTDWYFITSTLNPQLGGDLNRLLKKQEKAIQKVCVEKTMWSVEWTANLNPHIHTLVKILPGTISDSKLRQSWKNTFKDCGHVDLKQVIESRVGDKIQYILGNKWAEDKLDAVENDKELRKQYGLEPYYTTGDWTTELEE